MSHAGSRKNRQGKAPSINIFEACSGRKYQNWLGRGGGRGRGGGGEAFSPRGSEQKFSSFNDCMLNKLALVKPLSTQEDVRLPSPAWRDSAVIRLISGLYDSASVFSSPVVARIYASIQFETNDRKNIFNLTGKAHYLTGGKPTGTSINMLISIYIKQPNGESAISMRSLEVVRKVGKALRMFCINT